jgi:hypothetical protein
MNRFAVLAVNIAVISFLLNLVWENAQAPLYAGYVGFWQHFALCFWGVLGDVLIIAFLYGVLALGHKNWWWIKSWNTQSVALLAFIGMMVAILIEYLALSVGRWAYAPAMPLFIGTKTGLWPVLQMTILPYVTFYFSRRNMKIK